MGRPTCFCGNSIGFMQSGVPGTLLGPHLYPLFNLCNGMRRLDSIDILFCTCQWRVDYWCGV